MQRLGPFSQFNFFIGPNNVGKSGILSFISRALPKHGVQIIHHGQQESIKLDPLDIHAGVTDSVRMGIGIPNDRFIESVLDKLQHKHNKEVVRQHLNQLIPSISESGLVWVGSDVPYAGFSLLDVRDADVIGKLPAQQWQSLWSALMNKGMGDIRAHWIPESITAIIRAQNISFPKTNLIPYIRTIGPTGSAYEDFSGKGLIDRLIQIQSPEYDRISDRAKFNALNTFLKDVTGIDDIAIDIPHTRRHILVQTKGITLPLSSLGTGIEESIMLGAFCTLTNREIICIEEPELHLHPLLQRKLMAFLIEKTDNQYFIATHSPVFIDTPGAAIFRVSHDSQTRVTSAHLRKDRYEICRDLGHKASELLQSNAVVWVEGPSDRIYIQHWIRAIAPELVEGVHYSIMFYGGRLLSHLSADDEEVSDFISLRALNQNLIMVMDSDREDEADAINETKQRVESEIRGQRGVVWVTAGREIENYVKYDLLQSSVKEVYGKRYLRSDRGGRYDHALYFRRTAEDGTEVLERQVDKVKVAREVCRSVAELSIMDLRERLNEVVELIRMANR